MHFLDGLLLTPSQLAGIFLLTMLFEDWGSGESPVTTRHSPWEGRFSMMKTFDLKSKGWLWGHKERAKRQVSHRRAWIQSKHPLSTVIDSLMFDDSPRALVWYGASQRYCYPRSFVDTIGLNGYDRGCARVADSGVCDPLFPLCILTWFYHESDNTF